MELISSSTPGGLTPEVQQKKEVNVTLNPAKADSLFKSILIANSLSRTAILNIVKSIILGLLWNGAGIFKIDMVGGIKTKVDLNFIIDRHQFKLLSLFKNQEVHLIEHQGVSVYELTDRQNSVFLAKSSASHKTPTVPDFTEAEKLGVKVAMKEFKKLKSLAQSFYPPYAILRLYGQQLISVQMPGLAPHVVDAAAYRESKGEPHLSLKSFSLMMVPAEEIQLRLFRRESAYWMNAEAEIAIGTTIELFEQVFPLQR